jgi:hypothetical protein
MGNDGVAAAVYARRGRKGCTTHSDLDATTSNTSQKLQCTLYKELPDPNHQLQWLEQANLTYMFSPNTTLQYLHELLLQSSLYAHLPQAVGALSRCIRSASHTSWPRAPDAYLLMASHRGPAIHALCSTAAMPSCTQTTSLPCILSALQTYLLTCSIPASPVHVKVRVSAPPDMHYDSTNG